MLALIATGVGMSQPIITFSSLDSERIYLLPWTAPEFSQALDPRRAKEFDVLLPYTVLIKNASDRDIIAYSVRWAWTDENGKIRIGTHSIADLLRSTPRVVLPAHSSLLESPSRDLGNQGLPRNNVIHSATARLLAADQNARSVVISLDAVVFEDGSAAGPDNGQRISLWRSYMDADWEVGTHVSRGPSNAIRNYLTQAADAAFDRVQPPLEKESRNAARLLIAAAQDAETYEDCYVFMRGFFALELLTRMDQDGEDATIRAVKNLFSSKKHIDIRRKEQ